MFIYNYDLCGTLKNPHTIRKEQGMKFPVLWLASVSLSVWVGTEKGVRLAWHFGAKAEKPKTKTTSLLVHAIMSGKHSGLCLKKWL